MTEYTPTTALVRNSYAPHRAVILRGKSWYPDRETSEEEAAAEFDRWLDEHDRGVAERAWDEGHLTHGEDYRHNGHCRDSGGCIAVNPYRKNLLTEELEVTETETAQIMRLLEEE